MDTSSRIVQYGLKTAFNYIEKNPEQNLPKLMDWVDKLAGDGPDSYPSQRALQSARSLMIRTTTCISLLLIY